MAAARESQGTAPKAQTAKNNHLCCNEKTNEHKISRHLSHLSITKLS